MAPKSADDDVRLALLEEISQAHERRIVSIEEFQRDMAERLDQKIQLDAASNIQMERALTRAVTTLEQLVEQLKGVTTISDRADKLASMHEAMYKLAIKFIAAGIPIVAALWAIFAFFGQK